MRKTTASLLAFACLVSERERRARPPMQLSARRDLPFRLAQPAHETIDRPSNTAGQSNAMLPPRQFRWDARMTTCAGEHA